MITVFCGTQSYIYGLIRDSGRSHSSTRIYVSLAPTVAYDDVSPDPKLCTVKIPYCGTCLHALWWYVSYGIPAEFYGIVQFRRNLITE